MAASDVRKIETNHSKTAKILGSISQQVGELYVATFQESKSVILYRSPFPECGIVIIFAHLPEIGTSRSLTVFRGRDT